SHFQKDISNTKNSYHQKNGIIPIIHNYTNNLSPSSPVISNLILKNSCQPVINGSSIFRSLSTKSKYIDMIPPPNKRMKDLIALGGAILTFFFVNPILHFVISGALGFGVYKLVKRTLNRIWPPRQILYSPTISMNEHEQLSQVEKTFWRHIFPFVRGTTNGIKSSKEEIDDIYSFSIKKVQAAYNNNRDIRFLFGGYSDSSMIKFTKPRSVISETIAISDSHGNYQKIHGVTIEYIATGMSGESAFVKATGYSNKNNDVVFKEIQLLLPHTGQTINIPLQDTTNDFEYNKYGPNVMEAEYRDIKE
ncbi:3593_t:CDS:1, partial [Scutellospora calospora]